MPLDLAAGVIISHILVRGQLAERWARKGEEEMGNWFGEKHKRCSLFSQAKDCFGFLSRTMAG